MTLLAEGSTIKKKFIRSTDRPGSTGRATALQPWTGLSPIIVLRTGPWRPQEMSQSVWLR